MNFLDENGLGRLWAQIILKLNSKVPDGGTTGQVLKKTETGTEWADAQFKPAGKSYLTFSSPNSFTLKVNDTTKHWNGTLEYFSSNRTWTTWDGTTTLSAVADDGEYVLYLRGTGNTVITGNDYNYRWVLTGSDISCTGNIENLLDYATVTAGNHPTMADYCCYYIFGDCTALTQAPDLPATTLAANCYKSMFSGCTSLTHAPALPATTLADGCYQFIFSGCTSLTHAPALPATTLAANCYKSMFEECTSLTQAPALPATTLAKYCYGNMFKGCTSLTQAPALPATTLAKYCYSFMFRGCTSLTHAPALPATTLADGCYQFLFYGCTSLKLSTTQTGEYTQEYCIPSSGTGITANNALTDMFTSTGGTFTGTPEINTTYYLSTDNMIVRDTEIATLNGYVGSMIMVGAIPVNEKGAAGGVASLGSDGKVPGTQLPSLDYIPVNEKGAAGGVASLGADGKVPSAQLPKMGGEAYTATLTTSAWTQSGNRYAQTVNVTGVTTSTPVVLVDVALSGTDLDADAAALEAWGIVSANNVAQGAGKLTFYARSVPSVNIPVNVGVC